MWRKIQPIEWLILAVIVGVVTALLLPSGDRDTTHRVPTRPSPYGGIPASLAGDYHLAAYRGRHFSLLIQPDGRYSYIWMGCIGVCRRESGYVRRDGETLVLSPVFPAELSAMDRTFLPIRWGDRAYLVPPDEMRAFCDAVAAGDEPRGDITGRFYLRYPVDTARGLPELPEEWAGYLREKVDANAAGPGDDGEVGRPMAGRS